MAYYLVSYDLGEGNSSDDIVSLLSQMGARQVQTSVWIVEGNSRHKIFGPIEKLINDDEDILIVARIDKIRANTVISKETYDWFSLDDNQSLLI